MRDLRKIGELSRGTMFVTRHTRRIGTVLGPAETEDGPAVAVSSCADEPALFGAVRVVRRLEWSPEVLVEVAS